MRSVLRQSLEKVLQEQIAFALQRQMPQLVIDNPKIRDLLERLIKKTLEEALQGLEQGSHE